MYYIKIDNVQSKYYYIHESGSKRNLKKTKITVDVRLQLFNLVPIACRYKVLRDYSLKIHWNFPKTKISTPYVQVSKLLLPVVKDRDC